MEYSELKSILDASIFSKSKLDLLRKIADHPYRYIGLFRPSRPKTKIIQNLLQSHEIRFGDAFEILIRNYLSEWGCQHLESRIDYETDIYDIDQIFTHNNAIYFVEQKIRDDHDSTKKKGQIKNFEAKLCALIEKYKSKDIVGIFYFIDEAFHKNHKFYSESILSLANDYGVDIRLMYGSQLFTYFGHSSSWDALCTNLRRWRDEIPDLPEVNFDLDAQQSFEEIKNMRVDHFRKLLGNEQLDEIFAILSPEAKVLTLLERHFDQIYLSNNIKVYKTLYHYCLNLRQRLSDTRTNNANDHKPN